MNRRNERKARTSLALLFGGVVLLILLIIFVVIGIPLAILLQEELGFVPLLPRRARSGGG